MLYPEFFYVFIPSFSTYYPEFFYVIPSFSTFHFRRFLVHTPRFFRTLSRLSRLFTYIYQCKTSYSRSAVETPRIACCSSPMNETQKIISIFCDRAGHRRPHKRRTEFTVPFLLNRWRPQRPHICRRSAREDGRKCPAVGPSVAPDGLPRPGGLFPSGFPAAISGGSCGFLCASRCRGPPVPVPLSAIGELPPGGCRTWPNYHQRLSGRSRIFWSLFFLTICYLSHII